jgi:hypothetical protein
MSKGFAKNSKNHSESPRKIHTVLKDAVFLQKNFQKTSIYVLDSLKRCAANAKALVCRYL